MAKNQICWLSISSKNPKAQAAFYKEAFGWTVKAGPKHMGGNFLAARATRKWVPTSLPSKAAPPRAT